MRFKYLTKTKHLAVLCLLNYATVNTCLADDPLPSSRWTTTLITAVSLVRAAFDFASMLWNPQAIPEVIETRGDLHETNAFDDLYLPNGMQIDSPWIREEILPATDHNCALFGIYGRNDVTRAEAIDELVAAGRAQTDLGRRIRALMAPEILAHLWDADRAAAMQLLGGGNQLSDRRYQIILNLLPNLLQQYEANPTAENRSRLLTTLANARIFENYVRQVLGERIGPSDEDSYPMLGYIRGDTATGGMAGALAAIAATRGIPLNVYQRQGRDIVQVAGYVHDAHLTPVENNRVVDLLHTTADINTPGALNHFNLLVRDESPVAFDADLEPTESKQEDEESVVQPKAEADSDAQVAMNEENKADEGEQVEKAKEAEEVKEAEEAENENLDPDYLEMIQEQQKRFAEMRAKKRNPRQPKRLQRASIAAPIEEIVVLTESERDQFNAFLLQVMKSNEARIYNAFINAEHMALTQEDIEKFALFVTEYLRNFLTSQVYANGGRMYSDRSIEVFVQKLLKDHKKSFHGFHAANGNKVASEWIQFRRGRWIAHGILPNTGATYTDKTARSNYQLGLRRRGG